MSDFFDVSNTFSSQTTEIYFKRVLTGDSDSVRRRLISALERLGYDVIEEEPVLCARLAAKGWGVWYSSADVLDYARTLAIRLKPLGAYATRATFDYTIKHPYMSGGEKEVLVREAEAIALLAAVRAADKLCAVCGTESTNDSRFCRQCGAPTTSEQTELEVLRLTAETRAGHSSVAASAFFLALTSALTLITLVLASVGAINLKTMWVVAVTGVFLVLLSLLTTLFGLNRLNRALKAKGKERSMAVITSRASELPIVEAKFLAPQTARASVTEATTELLGRMEAERERSSVSRNGDDSDAVN